jgi:ribosomal protein S24E
MKRREMSASVEHATCATPSHTVLQQFLAKEWGVKPEQVDIKGIYTNAGKQASRLRVHVWNEPKVADLSKVVEKPAEAKPAEKAA